MFHWKRDTVPVPPQTCQVSKKDREPHVCDRRIHESKYQDDVPLCLMHSGDPDKSKDAFFEEFDRTLAEAETRNITANFRGFVFPFSNFRGRLFKAVCDFSEATFTEYAIFYGATFQQPVIFGGARFRDGANFSEAIFLREPGDSVPRANLDFQRVSPEKHEEVKFISAPRTNLDFRHVTLAKPEEVKFIKNDLGRARFFDTDVSKIDFGDITWCERNFVRCNVSDKKSTDAKRRTIWAVSPRKSSKGYAIFEEFADIDTHTSSVKDGSWDERNYNLIAKTYQQLKRNYDAQGDFTTAGQFHYGEMEMRRLHSRFRNPFLRWLSRTWGVTALYRWFSEYGEDYVRPLLWLLGTILLCGVLYPASGLTYRSSNGKDEPLTYSCSAIVGPFACAAQRLSIAKRGMMTSLQIISFERDIAYTPCTNRSRLLELSEHILGATFAGLAGLAARRRFRRN